MSIKQVIWVGSSHKDLKDFPPAVVHAMGYAVYLAQTKKMHVHAKVLSGMGSAGVVEIKENAPSGTYRVIYTLELGDYVFVLHAFQKKSTSGIATPKVDLDLIKNRLREATIMYKSLVEGRKKK